MYHKNMQKIILNSLLELNNCCKQLRQKDKKTRFKIYIKESSVKGNIKFLYSNFDIIGLNKVEIIGSKYSKQINEIDHKENTTWRTPTFKVTGNNNTFKNISIINNSLQPYKKGQQIALAIYGNNNQFIDCQIKSTQDTLFIGPLPDDLILRYIDFIPEDERNIEGNLFSYFKNCHITGTIDFIFGAGQAYFNKCILESIEDFSFRPSFITAPAHSMKDNFGFCFYKCNFISKTIFQQRVYLGRPWRDFGKSVFIKCNYGTHINSKGFINWENTIRYLSSRFEEYPSNIKRVDFSKHLKKIPDIYKDIIKKYK